MWIKTHRYLVCLCSSLELIIVQIFVLRISKQIITVDHNTVFQIGSCCYWTLKIVNCFTCCCVNSFKCYLRFSLFIGDNCNWKVRDTYFHSRVHLEPSTICFYTVIWFNRWIRDFVSLSPSVNHECLIFFFFLHPFFIFSNLAKSKSDYSESLIITYLKAQWLYSSSTFFGCPILLVSVRLAATVHNH